MLVNTEKAFSETKLKVIEDAWLSLIRRGDALRALEVVLEGHSPAQVRGKFFKIKFHAASFSGKEVADIALR